MTPPHLGGHCFICHTDSGALDLAYRNGCRSCLDVGCGIGLQVQLALQQGYASARGIDGDPAALQRARECGVLEQNLVLHDFTFGAVHPGQFDLLWSVEFLEHLEERFLPHFWEILKSTTPRMIIVTIAPPGMAGHHHVNLQTPAWWVEAFAQQGYLYSERLTQELRQVTTMKREFVRERGMVFLSATSD